MLERRARPSPRGSRAWCRSRSGGPRTRRRAPSRRRAGARCASVSWISPPAPAGTVAQVMEDARRQDVAADHARASKASSPGLGFSTMRVIRLDALRQPLASRRCRSCRRSAAATGMHADHRVRARASAMSIICFSTGDLGVDQIVGEQHGERLVADHRLGAQHRVPEPERLGLADVDAVDAARQHARAPCPADSVLLRAASSVSSS